MGKAPLNIIDYIIGPPAQDKYLLTQKRLAALKATIERTQLIKEKEQKEAEKKKKFITGLLGG